MDGVQEVGGFPEGTTIGRESSHPDFFKDFNSPTHVSEQDQPLFPFIMNRYFTHKNPLIADIMHKKARIFALPLLLIGTILLSSCRSGNQPAADLDEATATPQPSVTKISEPTPIPTAVNPVEGWAVLAEKDDYDDVDMSNLHVDYIDNTRFKDTLLALGWDADHIHESREFNREKLIMELNWLENNADENDIVILFVTAHGKFMSDHIQWSDFFGEEWAQIASHRRLLIIDTCTAAEFTQAARQDPNPHFSIAAVDQDEYGWKGLEEEGLPIVGGVFTYYFTEALTNLEADTNSDGRVSVREAATYTEEMQRTYMHEVVFSVREFVDIYHQIGVAPETDPSFPDVILDDNISEQFFLALDEY
jgi:hypothetical protein